MIKNTLRFVVILILISGCNDEQHINTYKIFKSPQKIISCDKPISWVLYESQSSSRHASFRVPYYVYNSSKIGYGDLSVTILSGGGSDQGNVNRWRKELNLPDLTEDKINESALIKSNDLGNYKIFKIINKVNNDNAYLCAIMPFNNKKVFVKLATPKIGISTVEQDFINFCQSFKAVEK